MRQQVNEISKKNVPNDVDLSTGNKIKQQLMLGVNVNFLTEAEGNQWIRVPYDAANTERHVELKKKYDPTKLCRVNPNIKPNA